jgi:DNA-binding LytR/AlgR family response regulator
VAVGPPAPWTLTTIQEWASNEFPEAFSTVAATINDLTFQELQNCYRLRNYKNPTVRLAPSTVNQLLLVGKGDIIRFQAEEVYVYVCSEKSGVGYLIHHGGNE